MLEEARIVVNLGWNNDVATTDIAQALVPLAGLADEKAEMSRQGRRLVEAKGSDWVLTEWQDAQTKKGIG